MSTCCWLVATLSLSPLHPLHHATLGGDAASAPSLPGRWEVAHPEMLQLVGDSSHPSVRYSASTVFHEGKLITTHGYFYNHDSRHPAWLSDAWTYEVRLDKWQKVHRGEAYGAPSARYSASAVVHDGGLYLFGGDDGGHKHSMNNYVFKAWFDELWRLDLSNWSWRAVQPAGGAGSLPPKRALHSAVTVGDAMYVYGGLELSDTWRFCFASREWTKLDGGREQASTHHPGTRHAHAAAAAPSGDAFYIFGGSRRGGSMKPVVFDDLYRFDIASGRWSRLKAPPSSGEPPQPWGLAPPARSHASLVTVPPSSLLLYGGARCSPGCVCYGDAWVYRIDAPSAGEWSRVVNTSATPVHRYRQGVVRDPSDGAIYVFGGESYRPYMYHNAVDRLRLTLQASNATGAAGASVQGGGGGRDGRAVLPVVAAGFGAALLVCCLLRKMCRREPERPFYAHLAPAS